MPRAGPILEVLQPADGGVAQHVLGLVLGLSSRGWPIEVATSLESVIVPALREADVPVHILELGREPGRGDLAAARALRSLDRRYEYRLVHAHSSKAGGLTRAALPDRRRLVYTPHCFAFAAGFGRGRRFVYQMLEQALVARCAAIVAVCEWERDLGVRRLIGGSERTVVIENGVPPCSDTEPDGDLRRFAGDLPLAGFLARLDPQKDPLAMVRAAALLAERGELPGRLAIVGDGQLRPAVEREIAALGLDEVVRCFSFSGGVSPYLSALDLFVLPSLWEAMPLAVLEAMRCGVPVLATRVGGVPEVVEEGSTGALVPPGDPAALAAALAALLQDPDRLAAMGHRAAVTARSRFDAERVVTETEGLYRRVLERA